MRRLFIFIFCVLSIRLIAQNTNQNLIQFVNPLVGTKNMGHTYPGATVPFGMVINIVQVISMMIIRLLGSVILILVVQVIRI